MGYPEPGNCPLCDGVIYFQLDGGNAGSIQHAQPSECPRLGPELWFDSWERAEEVFTRLTAWNRKPIPLPLTSAAFMIALWDIGEDE